MKRGLAVSITKEHYEGHQQSMNNQRGNAVAGLLVIVLIGWGAISLFSANDEPEYVYEPSSAYSASAYDSYNSSYNDYSAYSDDYESPPAGFVGTDEMEACNQSSGNCYDLEIDSNGENIERINFPNGGWRDVDSSDCDGGYCYVEDEDGTEWELQY